ncbi:uncharacterized protein TrAFT101_006702 [Trichoderma asperellum]|uniref:uncharacterized protein n=1 Tax=Trichoderma asperellum TaxID=101201 RepID=UPI0033169F68|nr:hypothetical protein TrAFT101_006702 [Trichoderma asperellum]
MPASTLLPLPPNSTRGGITSLFSVAQPALAQCLIHSRNCFVLLSLGSGTATRAEPTWQHYKVGAPVSGAVVRNTGKQGPKFASRGNAIIFSSPCGFSHSLPSPFFAVHQLQHVPLRDARRISSLKSLVPSVAGRLAALGPVTITAKSFDSIATPSALGQLKHPYHQHLTRKKSQTRDKDIGIY